MAKDTVSLKGYAWLAAPNCWRNVTVWIPARRALRDVSDVVREAALEKKAEDVVTIDVRDRTILADTFVIATGRSSIQTRAISDAVEVAVKAGGGHVARVEGYADGNWILIDAGTVIVHVFTPAQREFYNLERLWTEVAKRQQAQGGT